MNDEQLEFKVVLIGNPSTGKTCLINRVLHNIFSDTFPTAGSNIYSKEFQVDDQTIVLKFWDTAGQERFQSLNKLYYEGAAAIIVVYAVDDDSSKNIETHINSATQSNPNCILTIACNKIDLNCPQQEVNIEIGKKIADQLNIEFYPVSAKNGQNVQSLFQNIASQLTTKTVDNFQTVIDPAVTDSPSDKQCSC